MRVPERNEALFQNGIDWKEKPGLANIFNNLNLCRTRCLACPTQGMNFWLILFAAQVAVTVFAALREKKGNAAFEGDKLDYRS
jgi:hypothetical protein